MAPELRKRNVVSEAKKTRAATTKKVDEKLTAKTKRKAADDASPVSLKRQKPTKKTSKQAKPAAKPPGADKIKKPTKTVKAEPKEVNDEREEESSGSEEQQDDGVLLLADELDSSDEEVAEKAPLFEPGLDVGKVPAISTEVREAARPSTGERGVLYIGRIPHGFYEHEMRQYLSQFGPVTRLRISRNKKTGASKHFAFVEFEEESTAEIVAKTMDNYLLFGHILKVKMVPKGQVHEELFKGANRRFKKVPWNKMAGHKLAKPRTESAWEAKVEKERANRVKKAARLQALGYEFEAPQLKDVPVPQPMEKGEGEIKAIEATSLAGDGDGDDVETGEAEAAEEQHPKLPEPEMKTISAPKTKTSKAKASRSGKAKKVKA